IVSNDALDLAADQTLTIRAVCNVANAGDAASLQLLDGSDAAFGAKPHVIVGLGSTPEESSSYFSAYVRSFTDAPQNTKTGPFKFLYANTFKTTEWKNAVLELRLTSTDVGISLNGTDCGTFKHGLTMSQCRIELSLFSKRGDKGARLEWRD